MNTIIATIWVLFFCFQSMANAQDSITVKAMERYSYDFDIMNGQLSGAGAKIVQEAISEAHITMVGNTFNSKLDTQFSDALLTILDSNGYRKMALEEGWVSGNIIERLAKNTEVIRQFNDLNTRYAFRKEGQVRTPIPSLKSVEAGEFVRNAIKKDWAIFAIGLEDWISYKMIVDQLYINLPKEDQGYYKGLYQKSKELLATGYCDLHELSNEGVLKFLNKLRTSESFTSFMKEMEKYESNRETVYHFKKSLDYWTAYGNRNYFEKNSLSIEDAKKRLASLLKADGFDFSNDKLLVKMFIGHLAKGFTGNGFYGVGNMLHEMTGFHGNTSLSIALVPRFFERNGVVEDYLETDLYYLQIFKELVPLGKKDKWVLVDLRPFNEKFFYSPIITSPALSKVMERYDFLIIPKTDYESTMNVEMTD